MSSFQPDPARRWTSVGGQNLHGLIVSPVWLEEDVVDVADVHGLSFRLPS